jgi:hypothetical protein
VSDILFKVISAVGAVTGTWALFRSYWLTRSRLVLSQKANRYPLNQPNGDWFQVTLMVSNHSSQANSVVRWQAWMTLVDGKKRELPIKPGQITNQDGSVDRRFNDVPLNVGSHSTAEGLLTFFHINTSEFKEPLELKVVAHDMYGKHFDCIFTVPTKNGATSASRQL